MLASPADFRKVWAARINRALSGDSEARIRLRMPLPAVWPVALLFLALVLPDRVWTTLLLGTLGLLLAAYLWARSLAGGLSAARRLQYGWVSVGDRLEEEFTLTNRSGMPAPWVEIRDESNLPGYQAGAARSAGPTDRVRWRQSAVCHRRGRYRLGPWELHSGDPFGIFSISRRYESAEEITIHPPIHSGLPIPLPPGRSDGRVRNRERALQATTHAATVRDYQPNDPYRWIHWRTSARRDELYVRQFEQDASGDIRLVVDCHAASQLGEGDRSTEEHAVILAAALTAQALAVMRGVGLAAYGLEPQVIPPGLGEGQQWRLLRALALMRADGETDLERALREVGDTARRGSAAIIITPTARDDWLPELSHLARRGIECHVLLLDRPSFGGQGDSAALQASIRRLGIACHVVRRGEIGQPVAQAARRGFWEFKVTGTGKAIAVRRPRFASEAGP